MVRSQSTLLPIVLSLIEQRLELEQQLDPTLKAILRNQPLPPPPPPPMDMAAAGGLTAQPALPGEPAGGF
jgi:hypothetical protein